MSEISDKLDFIDNIKWFTDLREELIDKAHERCSIKQCHVIEDMPHKVNGKITRLYVVHKEGERFGKEVNPEDLIVLCQLCLKNHKTNIAKRQIQKGTKHMEATQLKLIE